MTRSRAPSVPSMTSLAPMAVSQPQSFSYTTGGGIRVERTVSSVKAEGLLEEPLRALDKRRGGIFASNYEYPDRYRRFDIAFVDPPLMLEGRGRLFRIRALNERGKVLLQALLETLTANPQIAFVKLDDEAIDGSTREPEGAFPEEERSRQPSIFSVLRSFQALMGSPADPHLGLYGAFGYDLVFQFEPMLLRMQRPPDPDLVLYLPDDLLVADHAREASYRVRYEFITDLASTKGMERTGQDQVAAQPRTVPACDHAPGEYASVVDLAREGCRVGDFFEVVPGQVFAEPCHALPSQLFERLCKVNPSPYGFLLNLGTEHLIGASPEMFVRVEGDRVETCPISGTIARGTDAISDAKQIRDLLNSAKDEAELTMCTDVDRNDKSRICVPGSVRVLGRRQLEMYSRVIHTVDHVEGRLLPGFDALDAFLSHTWAVTLTGAPKRAAMAFIEKVEKSPRRFYGGAIGFFTFNGQINTGITIRTIRLTGGVAEIRAGATLLWDSVPEDEERETRAKAAAMIDVVRHASAELVAEESKAADVGRPCTFSPPIRILLVDHEDSFVHTLANYFRQAGGEVTTLRAPVSCETLDAIKPDLVVLSPGPGRPSDYGVPTLVRICAKRGYPTFGVCLGLQGMVEAFGGELGVLPEPVHGKASLVTHRNHPLFEGIPRQFKAGRYHSLYAVPDKFPPILQILAESEDEVVMAISHRELPLVAVQFHPESILTQEGDFGLQLIKNALHLLTKR